jgi:type II secretory pathway pseudopilin PulG
MSRSRRGTQGAALLVALIVMAVLSVLAASVVRFSIAGLRVAVNEELRTDAFQRAQSLVDMALAVPQNLMINGQVGDINCVAGVSGCTLNTLQLYYATGGAAVTGTDLDSNGDSIRLTRIGPEVSPPPRGTGYSAIRFQAGYLEVESGYDGVDAGWGRAALNEGVTVIVPQYGG